MLTPDQIASRDCGYWVELKKIRLQTGHFSFTDHEYQKEPMSSKARRKCIRKGTQGGFTEIEVIDSLHGMRYKILDRGVLYLFPTSDDVNEFSKSRFNPFILANREAIGKFVKNTDTASLKKINNAFLYLRGARLSQKISDLNESSKLKSIPVDRVVFDEIDHMSEEVIAKAKGRMGHSKIKQERYLSNPLIPGEGIDKIFSESDQRYWFRKCHKCNKWTCAELFFMESPERCVGVRKDGTGYIACRNCGREIFIRDGQWEPQFKSNSDYMHGYQWSQLTSAFNDPKEILDDFFDPPQGNLADVYRLRLGLPYIAAEDRLTIPQILDCCSQEIMDSHDPGPCAMGVDVGKIKHVVIGIKIGKGQYRIVKTARVSEWNDIHDLAKRFNVKSDVVDIRPYEDSARKYQSESKHKTFLCEYKENTPMGAVYNDKSGIVAVGRTEIFDATHGLVTTPGQLSIPRYCPEIKEFAAQLCGAYKILETNKKTGISVYRYKGVNEHYRNALNYFLLAARQGRVAKAGGSRTRQKMAKNRR